MLKRSCTRKSKSQERKSLLPMKAHVIEPIVEDIKVNIEMLEQEREHKGIHSVDQPVQVEHEETNGEEITKESNHLMDLIASPPPANPIRPLDEKAINQEITKDHIIEVSHIDFIFGDKPLIFADCEHVIHIQNLKLPFILTHIRSKLGHQKKHCLKPA
eukprot:TRINITY_DN42496_c2_g1_i2.p1 TRINITY_DN42496_c2_g1~~TRINITY_DN42496_c2_g1_i2.p1  ORF type:complete len:159 (+),score=25.63 TRINITY_DN42496_c2_g1_i2:297-773(+)